MVYLPDNKKNSIFVKTMNLNHLKCFNKRINKIFVFLVIVFLFIPLFSNYSCANTHDVINQTSSREFKSGFIDTQSLLNSGDSLVEKKEYLHALQKYYLSLTLSLEHGNIKDQIESLKKIGVVHSNLTRFDHAISYFKDAFSLAKRTGDTAVLVDIFVAFAQIDIEKKDYKSANRFLLNALFLATKCNNHYPVKLSLVYRNLGLLYLNQNNYRLSLYYYSKTLSVDFAIKNYCQIGSLYTLIGHIYELTNHNSIAQEYNFKALRARKDYHQPGQYASSLLNIGRTYLKMDMKDSALIYLVSGVKMAEKNRNNYLLVNGYKGLFDLFYSKKDYASALKYFQLFSNYKDSVNKENNQKDFFIFLTNQAITDQERRTISLQQEITRQKLMINQRTIFIFLFVFLFLLMVVLASLIYYLLVKNRKARTIEEELNICLKREIDERIQTEQKLFQSEKNYRFISDNVLDMISRFDPQFKRNFISPSCERVWGYTPEELLAIPDILSIVHPDSVPVFQKALAEIKQKKEPIKMLYRAIRKDGKYFWAQNYVNPIFDPSTGELVEMISVMRDVTKQIEQEQTLLDSAKKKEFLMREMNHRVKNNFAILASLTGMHKRSISDQKVMDLFADLQSRVLTMALVHEQLYSTHNMEALPIGNYLKNLVNIISRTFNDNRVKVHTSFEEELLDATIVLPLGLIVNELITNVFKHAFPGKNTGNLWIEYKTIPSGNENPEQKLRRLIIRDDGVGLSENVKLNEDTTISSEILALLVEQLGAKLTIDSKDGACITIILPIADNK